MCPVMVRMIAVAFPDGWVRPDLAVTHEARPAGVRGAG